MVVAIICTGLIMLVAGETQFNLIGFVLVMTASMLSGLRWTITQVLLQGTDSHGVSLMTLASLPAEVGACHAMERFSRAWRAIPQFMLKMACPDICNALLLTLA